MDLKQRLSRIHFFDVKPDLTGLSNTQRLALSECIKAADIMHDLYLEQMGGKEIRELYHKIRRGGTPTADLFKLMQVHGGPWGDDHRSFVTGLQDQSLGAAMYPIDLTPEQWSQYLVVCTSANRDQLKSPYTRVECDGTLLKAVPYSEVYHEDLEKAGDHLQTAAALLARGPLESFLQMRAEAFMSNNYYDSDVAWVKTDGTPFEVTIGPYETYFDRLSECKAAFEAFIGIPDRQANEALARFGPAVSEVDERLAEHYGFKPSGSARPLEIVEDVVRGGEAAAGVLFMAYNLPNDRRIRTEVGSKNVFSATMMRAKFENLSLPRAARVLSQIDLDFCTFDRRLLYVIGHELAHGIGPSMILVDGVAVPFEQLIGPRHSCIEEAKADMLGALLLRHFARRGLISSDDLRGAVVTEVADWIRSWDQSGFAESHSQGHLMQYNWLSECGAVQYYPPLGTFRIDLVKTLDGMEALAHEFIKMQLSGDQTKVEAFIDTWAKVPAYIPELLESMDDLPSKVYPNYNV